MKFKIGDKVRVKKDVNGATYSSNGIFWQGPHMNKFIDTIQIIQGIDSNYAYKLKKGEEWSFDEEWLELVEKKKDISDITTYEVGDVLVDKFKAERSVMGICGKLIFLSNPNGNNTWSGAFTVEQVIKNNWNFKIYIPQPTEEETKAKNLLESLGYKIEK